MPSLVTDLTQKRVFYQPKILAKKGEKCQLLVGKMPDPERHLRPLLTGLKNDSERIKVWQDAVYDSQGEEDGLRKPASTPALV
jgi:hypothetical protein